jgi:predicted acyl esterase
VDATTRFPVLIFPNSWATPIVEYILKTLSFAEGGYVAIEYETRGWYNSGGLIDCAGPQDIQDAQQILDYVLSRDDWLPDPDNIAFVGISYGAGISMSVAGADPRVKTAVCLSGWSNITNMILNYNTPNLVWGSLLAYSAELLGHPPPELMQLYNDAMHYQNLSFIHSYCDQRSPIRFHDAHNARGTPKFISHNRQDRLFRSEYALELFTQLTTKNKFVMLNQGVHAEPEIFGHGDIGSNAIFNNVQMWLDHYLLGRDTDITQQPPVQFQLGDTMTGTTFVGFDTWPSPAVQTQTFMLNPRGGNQFGDLTLFSGTSSSNGAVASSDSSDETINYTSLPGLSAGVPILTALIRSVGIPYDTEILLVPKNENIIWRSNTLDADTRYCGVPTITLQVSSNKPSWQVYAFLYDVDAVDIAYLVSNAYYTHWGQPSDPVNVPYTLRNLQFHSTCRVFPAGHRVAVGVVLYSSLWQPAMTDSGFTVTFQYGNASLTMPFNPQ